MKWSYWKPEDTAFKQGYVCDAGNDMFCCEVKRVIVDSSDYYEWTIWMGSAYFTEHGYRSGIEKDVEIAKQTAEACIRETAEHILKDL